MEMKINTLPENVKEEKPQVKERYQLEVSKALTTQAENIIQQGIKIEQDSAQIYEAMSAFLDNINYTNCSKWFKTHAGEERKHSDWVITFLEEKNIMPILPAIAKPTVDWKSVKDVLKAAYEHEEFVTNFWNKAATECFRSGDHDAYQFCLFVIKEQREELDLFSGLIDLYNLSEGGSQLTFDQHVKHP